MKKNKQFSEFQLKRLAELGYWVEYWPAQQKFPTVICIKNGMCKYIRSDRGEPAEWSTLLWSCAPTKKAVLKEDDYANRYPTIKEEYSWTYFATFEELETYIKTNFADAPAGYHKRAPNDYEVSAAV